MSFLPMGSQAQQRRSTAEAALQRATEDLVRWPGLQAEYITQESRVVFNYEKQRLITKVFSHHPFLLVVLVLVVLVFVVVKTL